jgi:hypothetical protein
MYWLGNLVAEDSSTPSYDVWLPKLIGGTGSGGFVGRVAEMLFYNRVLNESERQQAEAYLQDRYQCLPSGSSEMSSEQSSESSSEESSSEESLSSLSSSSSSSESSDDNNSSSSSGSSSSVSLAVDFEVLEDAEHPYIRVVTPPPQQPRVSNADSASPTIDFARGNDPVLNVECSVRIHVPGYENDPNNPIAVNECKKWTLRLRQDIIGSDANSMDYTMGSQSYTVNPIPGQDGELNGDMDRPFTGNNNIQRVTGTDTPSWPDLIWKDENGEFIPAGDPDAGHVTHAQRGETYITRIYAERQDGEKRYFKWIKWEAKWNESVNVTFSSGVTQVTVLQQPSQWSFRIIEEGDGEGPEAQASSPVQVDMEWDGD